VEIAEIGDVDDLVDGRPVDRHAPGIVGCAPGAGTSVSSMPSGCRPEVPAAPTGTTITVSAVSRWFATELKNLLTFRVQLDDIQGCFAPDRAAPGQQRSDTGGT
jgi:hypothetical protein